MPWVKTAEITAEQEKEGMGSALAMSSDGTTIAIGSQNWDDWPYWGTDNHDYNDGRISIYKKNGSTWVKTGEITAEHESEGMGSALTMSSDGTTIAIGSQNWDDWQKHGYESHDFNDGRITI